MSQLKIKRQTSLTLNEEDYEKLEISRRMGYKIVDIFRVGLNNVLKEIQTLKQY